MNIKDNEFLNACYEKDMTREQILEELKTVELPEEEKTLIRNHLINNQAIDDLIKAGQEKMNFIKANPDKTELTPEFITLLSINAKKAAKNDDTLTTIFTALSLLNLERLAEEHGITIRESFKYIVFSVNDDEVKVTLKKCLACRKYQYNICQKFRKEISGMDFNCKFYKKRKTKRIVGMR